jgi:hypothetical protein
MKNVITRFGGSISTLISIKYTFKTEDVSQEEFLEDLGLLIIKKTITYPISGEYVAQTFNFLSLS